MRTLLCVLNCLQNQRPPGRRVIKLWKWKELYCTERKFCICCFKFICFVSVILILQIAEGHFQRITQVRKHLAELELSIQSQSSCLGQMEHVKGVNDDMSRCRELSSTHQLSFAAVADWKFTFCYQPAGDLYTERLLHDGKGMRKVNRLQRVEVTTLMFWRMKEPSASLPLTAYTQQANSWTVGESMFSAARWRLLVWFRWLKRYFYIKMQLFMYVYIGD